MLNLDSRPTPSRGQALRGNDSKAVFVRFGRTALTGGAATLVDLAALAVCIYVIGMDARLASLSALLAGAFIQFFGNRHYAFKACDGCIKRQALWFTATEIVTLGLNALVYDMLVTQVFSSGGADPMLARLISSHAVFLLWSFPVWHWVFRVQK
ncbi:MAG: GtrA family protein [Planctomycetes bacterium]|nr:GtrA family protein [Planctomycetota bacterium]